MRTLFRILLGLFLVSSVARADDAYFVGTGFLPTGSNSYAFGISGDGRVTVGYSSSDRGMFEAFRWTRDEGIQALPDIDNQEQVASKAFDSSYDGSTIVGWVVRANGIGKAFRWTEATGMVDLGDLPGGQEYSAALTISADGATIGGESVSKESSPHVEAFIWHESDGMIPLGELPDGTLVIQLYSLSADGTRGVGPSNPVFLWESSIGWSELPSWENSNFATPYAISANGETVVGEASEWVKDKYKTRPFRWTEREGMQNLGRYPNGGVGGHAKCVAADGSVIVGQGAPGDGSDVFIWDADQGMRGLKTVLQDDYGLDLSEWRLSDVRGMSDDGRTIVGYGHENGNNTYQGWVAHISRCNRFKYPLGDSDGSGSVDFNDIDCFVAALISKDAWVSCGTDAPRDHYDCVNDTNADGSVDFGDIDSFVTCLTDGCE